MCGAVSPEKNNCQRYLHLVTVNAILAKVDYFHMRGSGTNPGPLLISVFDCSSVVYSGTMGSTQGFIYRDFTKNGSNYRLTLSQPIEIEKECWRTTVEFISGDETIWSHDIFGFDSVQAMFLGLELGKVLLESEGGYLYLDQSDLQLTRDLPPIADQDQW